MKNIFNNERLFPEISGAVFVGIAAYALYALINLKSPVHKEVPLCPSYELSSGSSLLNSDGSYFGRVKGLENKLVYLDKGGKENYVYPNRDSSYMWESRGFNKFDADIMASSYAIYRFISKDEDKLLVTFDNKADGCADKEKPNLIYVKPPNES